MRFDESRIPKGGGVKVRCPRCKEMDYVEDPSLSKSPGKTPLPAEGSKVSGGKPVGRGPVPRSTPKLGDAAEGSEPSIPDDAFQGFRFPAEKDKKSASTSSSNTWRRGLIWGIVSLAIVAFFALLVNVVLWGPAGDKPFLGVKPSEAIERQSPE